MTKTSTKEYQEDLVGSKVESIYCDYAPSGWLLTIKTTKGTLVYTGDGPVLTMNCRLKPIKEEPPTKTTKPRWLLHDEIMCEIIRERSLENGNSIVRLSNDQLLRTMRGTKLRAWAGFAAANRIASDNITKAFAGFGTPMRDVCSAFLELGKAGIALSKKESEHRESMKKGRGVLERVVAYSTGLIGAYKVRLTGDQCKQLAQQYPFSYTKVRCHFGNPHAN